MYIYIQLIIKIYLYDVKTILLANIIIKEAVP